MFVIGAHPIRSHLSAFAAADHAQLAVIGVKHQNGLVACRVRLAIFETDTATYMNLYFNSTPLKYRRV
jgi:hypothetical protein